MGMLRDGVVGNLGNEPQRAFGADQQMLQNLKGILIVDQGVQAIPTGLSAPPVGESADIDLRRCHKPRCARDRGSTEMHSDRYINFRKPGAACGLSSLGVKKRCSICFIGQQRYSANEIDHR
jgi:hypothetical protein